MTRRSTSAEPAKSGAVPARKRAAKKSVAEAAEPQGPATEAEQPPKGGEGLLRAGLQALGNVHGDVVKHQSTLLEHLLGFVPRKGLHLDSSAMNAFAFPGLEGLGFRKFEDVFDQRIAAALQRLGMPSVEEWQALRMEVEQLRAELEQLKGVSPAKQRRTSAR
jgi:hypothetical protein